MKKVFKNRNFLLLWLGLTISGLGTWINFIGLNLLVHSIFNSGQILGIFMMARMLPSVFFGSVGGYLADKYSRKTIMITCDIIRTLLVLGFIFTRNLYLFFIIGIIISALDKVFMASNGAFMPNLVDKDELMEANSVMQMSHSVIMILGSALGGILLNSLDFKWVFIIDSFTFIASVICISLINTDFKVRESKKQAGMMQDFSMAFDFFKRHSSIKILALMRMIDAFGSGAFNTALPIFAVSITTSAGAPYGWLIGIWATGVFTGSILINKLPKGMKLSRETIFSVSVILTALGMGLTFHFKTIYPALVSIFMGGAFDGISNVLFNTMLMQESPDEIRGKIFGPTVAMIYTTAALGMAASGFFLDKHPLTATTDAAAFFIIVSICIAFFIYNRNKTDG